MRILPAVLILLLISGLLSGSSLAVGGTAAEGVQVSEGGSEPAAESLAAQQAEELAAFRAEVLAAAEELLAEKAGEIRREHAQKLHDAARELRDALQAEARAEQAELTREMLELQLELFLVSLSPEEEEARLARLAELQDELQSKQEELQVEYGERLGQLQAEHVEAARERLLAFRQSWSKPWRRKWRPLTGSSGLNLLAACLGLRMIGHNKVERRSYPKARW